MPLRYIAPLVAALSLVSPWAMAQNVNCHITFGGATRTFTVAPAASFAETPNPLLEGASLSLTVVNQLPPAPGAGVTVRTYSRANDEPVLLHQAYYLPDATPTGPHGFTGLQVVREPQRQREIAYWCERPAR